MNLEDCFEEGAMWPSSKEAAVYYGFPFYEIDKKQYPVEKHKNNSSNMYDFT